MAVQKIVIFVVGYVVYQFGMEDLFVDSNDAMESSALFERDGRFVVRLVFCFFPFYFEVSFCDGCWFNVLHVIYLDFLRDEVGLLQSCLVVVVDVAIYYSKIARGKS